MNMRVSDGSKTIHVPAAFHELCCQQNEGRLLLLDAVSEFLSNTIISAKFSSHQICTMPQPCCLRTALANTVTVTASSRPLTTLNVCPCLLLTSRSHHQLIKRIFSSKCKRLLIGALFAKRPRLQTVNVADI